MTLIRKYFIPVLLSSSIVVTILSIYTAWIPVTAIFVILFNIPVFCFCHYVKNNGIKGALFYILVLLVFITVFFSVTSYKSDTWFDFLMAIKYERLTLPYFLLLFFECCFFLSSAIFYFTEVRYRGVVILLLIFIPCGIYYAQSMEIPAIYIALLIALYFTAMIDSRKNQASLDAEFLTGGAYKQAVAVFVTVLFVLAVALPKSDNTPFNILRSDMFDSFKDRAPSLANLSSFTRYSGSSASNTRDSDVVLFTVFAGEPLYLKRQVFGAYDGTRWHSMSEEFFTTGYANWSDRTLQSDTSPDYTRVKTAIITHMNFATAYIPHPSTTFKITGIADGKETYQTKLGEIFCQGMFDANEQYEISYMDHKPDYFLNDVRNAELYALFAHSDISDEISALAQSITADKTDDFEKAKALEDYFQTSGYTYDLDYLPPEGHEDIEYFIFESKTGACYDFATAMTLMARSVGLKARYVEGFYADVKVPGEACEVRVANSHAYAEIFIPAYGWTVFEPTVPDPFGNIPNASPDGSPADSFVQKIIGLSNHDIMAVAIAGVCLAALAVYFIRRVLLPPITEFLFRRAVQFGNPREGVISLYTKIQKTAAKQEKTSLDSFTPRMLQALVYERYAVDINILVNAFESAAFKDTEVSREELADCFDVYKRIYSHI